MSLSVASPFQLQAQAELEKRRRQERGSIHNAPTTWRKWARALFPSYYAAPFAERHEDMWEWAWSVEAGKRPHPFVALWPRGGGKSATAQAIVVAWGARQQRRYVWYVSETQDQADKHLENLSEMLESSEVERYYPSLASRKLGKYGNSRGWRRNRLYTDSGFVIDAIGLDTARRGARVAEQRPDAMVFDDIDGRHDSLSTVTKKTEIVTQSLLPAGSNDVAVLFVQNEIHADSIASQLADGRADFLIDRIVSGPFKAIDDLAYDRVEQDDGRVRYVITGGTATWEGQSLEVCQQQIDTFGITSFLRESQHDLDAEPAAEYRHCTPDDVPDLVRIVVWLDPAVTSHDGSDCQGIQVDGIAENDVIYRLWSWEGITSPEDAMKRAIRKALELGANKVGVETDQGGDTWVSVFERAWDSLVDEVAGKANDGMTDEQAEQVMARREQMERRKPGFDDAKAGAGYGSKAHRNSLMMSDYGEGSIIHVLGTHTTLERALNRFSKGAKPFDLADAAFWAWNDLRNNGGSLLLW